MYRKLVSIVTCGTLFASASLVHAISPAAEALFEEGRKLFADGQTDSACARFAESLAIESSSGTLLNLALCHETQGKIATAWAEYRAAARLARNQARADRATAAEAKAAALEVRLPHLICVAERPPPGLKIAVDDGSLGEGALQAEVPVDPGVHRVTATAKAHRAWTVTVEIKEGERRTVTIPALDPEPQPAPSVPEPVASVGTSQPPPPPPPSTTTGWVVSGAGVLSLAVGAYFGLSSLSNYATADRLCPMHHSCGGDALDARDRAETRAWISNAGIGLGALAVAIGGYLIWSHRARPERSTAQLRTGSSPGGGWIGIEF